MIYRLSVLLTLQTKHLVFGFTCDPNPVMKQYISPVSPVVFSLWLISLTVLPHLCESGSDHEAAAAEEECGEALSLQALHQHADLCRHRYGKSSGFTITTYNHCNDTFQVLKPFVCLCFSASVIFIIWITKTFRLPKCQSVSTPEFYLSRKLQWKSSILYYHCSNHTTRKNKERMN